MNTSAHAIINLLVLSREPDHHQTAAIVCSPVLAASVFLFRRWPLSRPWLVTGVAIYLLYWIDPFPVRA